MLEQTKIIPASLSSNIRDSELQKELLELKPMVNKLKEKFEIK